MSPVRNLPILLFKVLPMRTQNELRHTRTRLRSSYALFPLEGYPPSQLPDWKETEAFILTSPAMGARFAQYLLTIGEGGGGCVSADGIVETFFYVLDGKFSLTIGSRQENLVEGSYALVPPDQDYALQATSTGSILLLRKRYEEVSGVPVFAPLIGHEKDVPADVWLDIEGARLQTLVPEEMSYDLAMNIFTFQPGYSLPVVETHVMEHGLYFLQGKGLYYLDGDWMEVEEKDFIWMGPYVPQSFYATGTVAAKYIYYKNVNRDVSL